jgi:dTDP-4-amino-4,6-dideoxygalactose transaminase
MAERSPEEIRASIEENRKALALEVVRLRGEVADITDWRKQIQRNQAVVLAASALSGFLVGGGLVGLTGILTFRRHRRRKAQG